MSFFKNIYEGISSVGNMVTSSISPCKVQLVKVEAYDSNSVVNTSHCLKLFKIPGCYDCVFTHPSCAPKAFSIFRLVREGEALALFKSYTRILTTLSESTSALTQEDKIQPVLDCIREHQTWNVAHVAAYVGFFEAFKHEVVKKDINAIDSVSGLTPLMAGIIGRQKHCVHEMLLQGARIDIADNKCMTAYHYGVTCMPDIIDFLTDHDEHKTFDWMNEKGETPLYVACLHKPDKLVDPNQEKHHAVEMLLVGGADPSITKTDRLPIHVAVSLGERKCAELIIKKHRSQKEARDAKYGGTPLHWAESKEMVELLFNLGCDLDLVSSTGLTPIHVMLVKDRVECLMELICYGADCNIGDDDGNTPLHMAVQRDDVDLVRNFIVFGTDVNKKNKQGVTPRHLLSISKGKNKEVILNMLHVSGAKRCSASGKGCMAGCAVEGGYNGKADEKWRPLFSLDKIALFDDMLCTVVSCSAQLDKGHAHGHGEAVLDLTDGPTEIGDRVLCLDGGGIRGLVLTQILSAFEEAAETPIKELFDWIGGTSTGGILALGIAVGKPLPYMRGLYFRLKDQVFVGSRPYDSVPFEELLRKEFGDTRVMTEIKHPKVIVTGVLADRFPPELHLFRTYQPSLDRPAETKGKNEVFERVPPPSEQLIWKAARSTGAAPTYFRAFAQYIDGGMISNNPTLDVLTEIHEYNTGLKIRHEQESIHPLGVVVSLGCGRPPVEPRDHIDVFKPAGIMEAHKVYKGTTALFSLLVEEATIAEGRPVDRARAWCSMINVPFYRFSPQMCNNVNLDCTDNATLINMLWETQCYIVANKHRIQQVAQLLKAGRQRQVGKHVAPGINRLELQVPND